MGKDYYMRRFVFISVCFIALLLSCGNPNNHGKKKVTYPNDDYNLMQIFELPDVQYLQKKTKLIDRRSFEEGLEWAREEGYVSNSEMRERAEDLFTSHYGSPSEMTDNASDEYVYERLRDDYVRYFSDGCQSVMSND